MTEAIFRENENAPQPRVSRLAGVEVVDVGAFGGFLAVAAGLAMIWIPLAFIIPGGLVLVVCLWRILRPPKVVR